MFIFRFFILIFALIGVLFTNIRVLKAADIALNNNPYKIKKGQVVDKKVKNLLIVTSIDPKESEFYLAQTKKINYLAKIIKSHWSITVDIVNVSDYQTGSINNYDALFFIEEYNETIPVNLKSDILRSKSQEIILSGFASDELASNILGTPLPKRTDNFFLIP